MPRTTRKSNATANKITKGKQNSKKPGQAPVSRNARQSKTAAKNVEEEILAATSSESEDTFVAEMPTSKQSKEEKAAKSKRIRANDCDTTSNSSSNRNENVPPKPNKMPRRSTRAAAINKLSLYADSDDDSLPATADSGDDDASIVQKSKNATNRVSSKASKRANKKGHVVEKKSASGEDSKPPRDSGKSPRKILRISTTTPVHGGAKLRKPSPASSSIKEITSAMWQPNDTDWRVVGGMDY